MPLAQTLFLLASGLKLPDALAGDGDVGMMGMLSCVGAALGPGGAGLGRGEAPRRRSICR